MSYHTPEGLQRIREKNRARWTPEDRAALSARNRDRWTDPEYRARMAAILRENARAQRDPTEYRLANLRTGERWNATRHEIAEQLGVRPDTVARFLRGDNRTCRGWRLGV